MSQFPNLLVSNCYQFPQPFFSSLEFHFMLKFYQHTLLPNKTTKQHLSTKRTII